MKRLEDYLAKLDKGHVVADRDRRKSAIIHDAKNLALAQGLELVEDEGLLEEVAGLVEWPVVLLGEFDRSYLDIPPEVIRATIRANQKCFVLRDPKTGKLANKFILVSNLEAKDGGAAIKAGNARVIRARLADAKSSGIRTGRPSWKTGGRNFPRSRSTKNSERRRSGSSVSHGSRKSLRRS